MRLLVGVMMFSNDLTALHLHCPIERIPPLDLRSFTDAWLPVMATQGQILELPRCPHCQVDKPSLPRLSGTVDTSAHDKTNPRSWVVYRCTRCGGAILTASKGSTPVGATVTEQYPSGRSVADDIPNRARELLVQANESLSAPAGAVVLAASSVDAMLKARGLVEGTLYHRIDRAAAERVITADMAEWAHEVRLDANAQRHVDLDEPLPTDEDAVRALEFAIALAEYLFVLPARVKRGRTKKQT